MSGRQALALAENFYKSFSKDDEETKRNTLANGGFFREQNGEIRNAESIDRPLSVQLNAEDVSTDPPPTAPAPCQALTLVPASGSNPAFSYATTLTYSGAVPNGVCAYLTVPLSAIDMNYTPNNNGGGTATNANIVITTGVTCNNCWAYAGATIVFYIDCSAAGTCYTYFSAGGGLGYNLDLSIVNPSISASSQQSVVVLPRTPSSGYNTIFSANGFTLQAAPTLNVIYSGQLTAQGSLSLTSSFSTQAAMVVSLPSGSTTVYEGFSEAITLPASTLSNTNFQLTTANSFMVGINMEIEWSLGYGVPEVNAAVNINTPITATYTFTQTSNQRKLDIAPALFYGSETRNRLQAAPTCTSAGSMDIDFALTGFVVQLGGTITVPTPSPPATAAVAGSTGTTCLTSSSPTAQPSAASGGGGGGGGSSSSSSSGGKKSSTASKLTKGQIAAAVIVPILFVAFLAAGIWFKIHFDVNITRKNADGSKNTEMGSGTSNPVVGANAGPTNSVFKSKHSRFDSFF